jgi:hypothetical protein
MHVDPVGPAAILVGDQFPLEERCGASVAIPGAKGEARPSAGLPRAERRKPEARAQHGSVARAQPRSLDRCRRVCAGEHGDRGHHARGKSIETDRHQLVTRRLEGDCILEVTVGHGGRTPQ